jgi:ankyrin repeat protein
VICGHIALSEYLLISGADPNQKTSSGDSALHSAVESNRLDLVQILVKFGADINSLQSDGETPLHLACFKGNCEIVQYLLDNKADPNVQNSLLGKTPLHYAVDYNYSDITRLLLKAGASHQIKDKFDKNAKDSARSVEILALFLESPSGIPSPEPSEILQKSSEDVSGVLSKSDSSFTSELKAEEKGKIFGFSSKIRQTVRASVENSRLAYSSFLNEPDEEKTAVEAFDKKKLMSFGSADSGSELYVWLCRRKLEQAYNLLVDAGYDDLKQIKMQMLSIMPICENSLQAIGIRRPGIRKRLLLAFQELADIDQNLELKQKSFLKCCSADVSSNVFIANCPALEDWLENLCLKQFYSGFVEGGYEEMDQLLKLMNSPWEITADDLNFIGIDKPGYRHRILSKLKEDAFYLIGKKKPEEKKTNEFCSMF